MKESHKESSKNIPNADSLKSFGASGFIETADANIVTEVTNSIPDSSNSIDFAVTDSKSININKTSFDSTETLKLKLN